MTLAGAADAAVLVPTGYVLVGLALEHAAYILQYGSVFSSPRRWLERKACSPQAPRLARWLCARVRELIGCQLCSITQLAIWFCAAPATVVAIQLGGARPLGLSPAVAAWVYALLFLGVAFSTAAVGLICWDVARLVGRGTDAAVLYLRARRDAAEAAGAPAARPGSRPPRPTIVPRALRRLSS